MTTTAIVGANWGDEGKGKIVDSMAGNADMVIRFQGGRNAGHTVINSFGKFALHLLPSGVFYTYVTNILGPGTAFDIQAFLNELQDLEKAGVPRPDIYVSERAQVVMPWHTLFDKYEEERLGYESFGSTKSGIAPFYADKCSKIGIQVADLYDEDRLYKKIKRALESKNILLKYLYKKPVLSAEKITEEISSRNDELRPFVKDTAPIIRNALRNKKNILLEGQLGALRDPDHGIYPMTTSSSPLAGYASTGAGIPPYEISRIIAVTKAYSTCVGAGPFVTELTGKQGNLLRKFGGDSGEYGATTGRPRRVGWFDAVATRYGCRVQGATEIALTCLDVLNKLDELKICTAYMINGKRTEEFPAPSQLDHAKPVFENISSWKEDIKGINSFSDLPQNAQKYIKFIETKIGFPIKWISTGPKRNEIFYKNQDMKKAEIQNLGPHSIFIH